MKHSKVHGAYCLGIFQNGRDPTTLLGGIVVRNTLVMYDRENSKIGFWKTNCSELWERLHITGVPTPLPSSWNKKNSTAEMSPTLAPSGQPHYVRPDKLQIGQVTFKMSLNVSYSDLKPHIAEFIKSFAQELGIKTSQVHLLNVMAKGNGSLIQWAIVPLGSADYISNATAFSMVELVAEHNMRLPHTFGSYQLIQWTIEPLVNRTWWQQHYLLTGLAIAITLILVLSAFVVLFILRQRQQRLNAYKPVDAVVAEQELQPL